MGNRTLLSSQKDQVVKVIQSVGIDPSNFQWLEVDSKDSIVVSPDWSRSSDRVSKIIYRTTAFYFLFDLQKGVHYAEFSPGKEELMQSAYPVSWEGQLGYVRSWLEYLKRKINERDS